MAKRLEKLLGSLPPVADILDYQAAVGKNGHHGAIRNPYYAGLKAAADGDLDKAEKLLESALAQQSYREAAGRALAEVYRLRAEACLGAGDVSGAAAMLTRGQSLDQHSQQISSMLSDLSHVVPVLHILEGRREQAREAWFGHMCEQPDDLETVRSLALLHFFWARDCLQAGKLDEAATAWIECGQYWSMVLRSEQFRDRFAADKSKTYGRAVDPQAVEAACNHVAAFVLREIDSAGDEFRGKKDDEACRTVSRAYGAVLGEIRGAELLSQAIALLGDKVPTGTKVGGPMALAAFGGSEQARQIASQAAGAGMDPQAARRLEVAYSGQAPEWGLVEANYFEVACCLLEANGKRSKEQDELLVRSWVEMGNLKRNEDGSPQSFDLWLAALKMLGKSRSPLKEQIEQYVLAAAKPATTSAKTTSLSVMRELIDNMRKVGQYLTSDVYRSQLSHALEQLGLKENNESAGDSSRTEGLLEEALKYNPGNQTARQVLSSVLSGNAVEKVNKAGSYNIRTATQAASRLLIKALELDPNNQHARNNARELAKMLMEAGMATEALELMQAAGGF